MSDEDQADQRPDSTKDRAPEISCASGTCGGQGLCPGIALMISWGVGLLLTSLSGREWIGWTVAIPLGLILLTGAWKWLPRKS